MIGDRPQDRPTAAQLAMVAVVGLLWVSVARAAIVVTAGPTYAPGGEWTCTPSTPGTEKLSGGATYSCSGTPGAIPNLYLGIKNNDSSAPIGYTMNSDGATQPSGSEIFQFSSNGATTIRYTGQTSYNDARAHTAPTVFTRLTLTFSGAGSVIHDATTEGLTSSCPAGDCSAANGSVHALWRIDPTVASMTINVLIEASDNASGPWAPADEYFGTDTILGKSTDSEKRDVSNVDLAFYSYDPTLPPPTGCGTQQEQCNSGECCDTATCKFKGPTEQCGNETRVCHKQYQCTGRDAACPIDAPNNQDPGIGCNADDDDCTLDDACDGNGSCVAGTLVCQASAKASGKTSRKVRIKVECFIDDPSATCGADAVVGGASSAPAAIVRDDLGGGTNCPQASEGTSIADLQTARKRAHKSKAPGLPFKRVITLRLNPTGKRLLQCGDLDVRPQITIGRQGATLHSVANLLSLLKTKR